MAHIEIDPDALLAMREHALREYPHECCGALFGRSADASSSQASHARRVDSVMPIDNVTDEDRRRRFSVSPRDYIRAEREALRLGLALLGFYHSHPDHPAEPSVTDRRFAQPGFSYPIISVTEGRTLDIRSWRLREGEEWYEEEEVRSGEAHVRSRESGVGSPPLSDWRLSICG